jgi:hypothetical protein
MGGGGTPARNDDANLGNSNWKQGANAHLNEMNRLSVSLCNKAKASAQLTANRRLQHMFPSKPKLACHKDGVTIFVQPGRLPL